MNLPELTYRYYKKLNADTCYIVLHGGGAGIDSSFIQKTASGLEKLGSSVLAFNFKYREREDDRSSGPELQEEQDTLEHVIAAIRKDGHKNIVIVAKSLGAITASYLWKNKPEVLEGCKIAVMGYCVDDVLMDNIKDSLLVVVQGEHDKFSTPENLQKVFKGLGIDAPVYGVDDADHSYRNTNGEPQYEDKAVSILVSELSLHVSQL